jgi:hypothetical protein
MVCRGGGPPVAFESQLSKTASARLDEHRWTQDFEDAGAQPPRPSGRGQDLHVAQPTAEGLDLDGVAKGRWPTRSAMVSR